MPRVAIVAATTGQDVWQMIVAGVELVEMVAGIETVVEQNQVMKA